jgi:hypothetical protein
MQVLKSFLTLCMIMLIVGCSTTGDVYSGKKGEKFDMGKTVGLAIGAALAYDVAKNSGGGSGYTPTVKYRGTSYDDDDWDYLPGSSQYRCRSRSSGEFVSDYLCSDDVKEDSWY